MMSLQAIGRYEIIAELGRGGMATVFRAYDPQFKREVAIKMLPPELLHNKEFRARFEREATTVAGLEHSAIVPVYDFGEQDGQPYLVMRYIPGGSLADRIEKSPLPIEEVCRILARLAPALDYAHQKGVIHRDLKPDNILFDQQGEPYLTDFGIAKLGESSARLTGNAIVGTPAYMSPEQGRGDPNIDGRSDIYSMGIIAFEALTGKIPYEANTPMGQVFKHLTDPIPNILDFKKDLPAGVQSVIVQALAKRAYVRFSTTQEFADALLAASRGEIGEHKPAITATMTITQAEGPTKLRPSSPRISSQPNTPVPNSVKRRKPPHQVSKKKFELSPWFALVIVVLLVGSTGGWYFFTGGLLPTSTPPPVSFVPTATIFFELETPTPDEIIPTIAITITPTETELPAEEPTQEITVTPTPEPVLPMGQVIGGADQIAFVSGNDIYISDMDATDLTRLTQTGGIKHGLQWTPDGEWVTFIIGKCVQAVNVNTLQIKTILCVNWADSLGGFEFSPDGEQVALSLSYGLFIMKNDLQAISQIRTKDELDNAQKCVSYRSYVTKAVRWSRDSKSIAVVAEITDLGRKFDQILVLDVSRCGPPVIIDAFPHNRFDDMRGYFQNPIIIDFAWDGDRLFAVNVNSVNGYGEIYLYNMETKVAEVIDPLQRNCCYRNFRWSPDLEYFFFSFQDRNYHGTPKPYYIIFGTIGTGAQYQPLPYTDDVLNTSAENLQPAIRRAPNN